VRRLTADRLARGIRQGLLGLRRYTAEAEALAYHMSREDGVATAASIIERLATEA
jgi:UDP:flavonoid glycosyltransferase YjiC (YdhE family)